MKAVLLEMPIFRIYEQKHLVFVQIYDLITAVCTSFGSKYYGTAHPNQNVYSW